MTNTTALTARVATGVSMLNENMPGWANTIDLNALNMASTPTCIVGQLSGERYFHDGVNTLSADLGLNIEDDYETTTEWGVTHGFEVSFDMDEGDAYTVLTGLWRQAVKDNR